MIPLFKVHYPIDVGQKIEACFNKGIITEGEVSDAFEQQFAKFVSNPYTSLVNSCTSALVLAYRMCDVGPGTEVITTPMTCMATNEPIVNAGADIVWADIDPRTGNIDPTGLEKLISRRTRAIVGVHWAGDPFMIDEVMTIAKNHGIPVIADAAHALGAKYKGRDVATCCDFTVFSFQAIKHLTTGDGGAISSRNKLHHERLKLLRWFGIDRGYPGPKWEQDIIECGYKFHMNNITAAIGLEQMKYIDEILQRHRKNAAFYNERITNPIIDKLATECQLSTTKSSNWIYTILVDWPDHFKQYMAEKGIAVDRVHVRNDHYTVFNRFRKNGLKGVDEFCSRMINIPVGWWLSDDDLQRIVDAVNSYGP